MERNDLKDLLEAVAQGRTDVTEALGRLQGQNYVDLGGILLDPQRKVRTGGPEIIFGSGKSRDQLERIAEHFAATGEDVLFTRIDADRAEILTSRLAGGRYDETSRCFLRSSMADETLLPGPALLSAGASDASVVGEIAATMRHLGRTVDRVEDCGVAGIHRLLGHLPRLRKARVAIVVAGMDGALPSVVAGLLAIPVIGVPTSVGYGPGGGGLTPLLTMLASCAPGLTVVNVDNGVGAAYAASRILQAIEGAREGTD